MIERRIQDRRTATVTVSLATMQLVVMAGNQMQMKLPEGSPEYLAWESALSDLRKETAK